MLRGYELGCDTLNFNVFQVLLTFIVHMMLLFVDTWTCYEVDIHSVLLGCSKFLNARRL